MPLPAPGAHARLALALCLSLHLSLGLPTLALAQYQCADAAGGVVYQQSPCAAGQQQRILAPIAAPLTVPSTPSLTPSSGGSPRAGLRGVGPLPAAGDVGPVRVGMSQSQVLEVLGPPDRSRTVQDGAAVRSHWGYHRESGRTVVVLEGGVVRAVQADEGAAPWAPAPRTCATAAEIREIEIDISKIQNRDNPLVQQELQRRLSEARACR